MWIDRQGEILSLPTQICLYFLIARAGQLLNPTLTLCLCTSDKEVNCANVDQYFLYTEMTLRVFTDTNRKDEDFPSSTQGLRQVHVPPQLSPGSHTMSVWRELGVRLAKRLLEAPSLVLEFRKSFLWRNHFNPCRKLTSP